MLTQQNNTCTKTTQSVHNSSNSQSDSINTSKTSKKSRKRRYFPRLNSKHTQSSKSRVEDTLDNLAIALRNLTAPRGNHAYMYTHFPQEEHQKHPCNNYDWSSDSDKLTNTSSSDLRTEPTVVPDSATPDDPIVNDCSKSVFTAAEYGLPSDLDTSSSDHDSLSSSDTESLGNADELPSISLVSNPKLAESSLSATNVKYKCILDTRNYSFYYEPIHSPPIKLKKGRNKIRTKESNKVWIPKVIV